MSPMTYHCQFATESFKRIAHLDRQSCGIASPIKQATPTMAEIAFRGVTQEELGKGYTTQQRLVAPCFQTYDRVRKDTENPLGRLKKTQTLQTLTNGTQH